MKTNSYAHASAHLRNLADGDSACEGTPAQYGEEGEATS